MSVVFYVVSAICLYKIGRRREIRGSWTAWIPFFGEYLMLGKIADHYDRWRKGKDRRLRVWLLVSAFAVAVYEIVLFGYSFWLMKFVEDAFSAKMMTGALLWLIVMLALLGMMIAICVVYGITLHRVYYSCKPKRAALLTTMSIVFCFWCIGPIVCLLCAYRKDDGFMLSEIVNEEEERKRLELYN